MTPGWLARRGLATWVVGLVFAAVCSLTGFGDLVGLEFVPIVLILAFGVGAGLILMAMIAKSIQIGIQSARD